MGGMCLTVEASMDTSLKLSSTDSASSVKLPVVLKAGLLPAKASAGADGTGACCTEL